MKVTHYFDLLKGHCGLKKSVTLSLNVKYFFGPVTSVRSCNVWLQSQTVAGALVGLKNSAKQSTPATVIVYSRSLHLGGLCSLQLFSLRRIFHAARRLFQCHYVTEYIMTITNHIRRIEALASQVIEHVDDREYENAHLLLDELEGKVHEARRHIDNLQWLQRRKIIKESGG